MQGEGTPEASLRFWSFCGDWGTSLQASVSRPVWKGYEPAGQGGWNWGGWVRGSQEESEEKGNACWEWTESSPGD